MLTLPAAILLSAALFSVGGFLIPAARRHAVAVLRTTASPTDAASWVYTGPRPGPPGLRPSLPALTRVPGVTCRATRSIMSARNRLGSLAGAHDLFHVDRLSEDGLGAEPGGPSQPERIARPGAEEDARG